MLLSWLSRQREQRDTCALIGNGPHTGCLDAAIDQAFVIRLNAFSLAPGRTRIGARTDLIASSLAPGALPERLAGLPVLQVLPDEYYEDRRWGIRDAYESSCATIDDQGCRLLRWSRGSEPELARSSEKLERRLGGRPTSGMLVHLLVRAAGFKRILLAGFTFYRSIPTYYWMEATEPILLPHPTVRPAPHDVDAERALVRCWVRSRRGPRYELDGLTRRTLEPPELLRASLQRRWRRSGIRRWARELVPRPAADS